ncbi:transcriptional regulator [Saccharothrix sp. NRRL B-16348]|nr:transcriptional regulator [Saccharothrix sp. NRRL B-16348]
MLRGVLATVVLIGLLAGLPWALTHFVGWPLPDHPPSWAEIEGVLLGPMTTGFLLDFLACTGWLVWALFTLDVAGCAIEIVRDVRPPNPAATAGPVHRVAAVLVGATLISVLGHRAALTQPNPPSAGPGTGSEVVATATAWNHPSDQNAATVRAATYAAPHHTTPATTDQPASAKAAVALAPDPITGVHDSLWRIAQRTLGDGNRWPEIWELNKGKPQPGGGTFTRPSLIFPGEEFALPAGATVPSPPPEKHVPPPPVPEEPAPTTSMPRPGGTVTPAPSTRQAPQTTHTPQSTPTTSPSTRQPPPTTETTPEPAIGWGVQLFVGLGLASAVSTALMIARRRHNSRYRPGSGDRTDLPVAPVVYQLRLAHLRAEQHDDDGWEEGEERVPPPAVLVVGASGTGSGERAAFAPGLGIRDGREIALDLAASRGVGLVGAGAPATVRALVVATLTTSAQRPATSLSGPGTRMFIPAVDLAWLLGHGIRRARLPAALRVVADLDAALDALEAETLVRAGTGRRQGTASGSWPPLVLVARTPEHRRQRLQAVLDNGAPFGITGFLLGQWQPGVTAYVREDGTVSATGPGLGEALRGTRMFHLGDDDTTELLTLLHQAQPDTPGGADVPVPPIPRSRIVSAEPTANHRTASPGGGPSTTSGVDGDATEAERDIRPEATIAAGMVGPTDTELEILGSCRGTTSGVRLRPAAVTEPQLAVPPPPEAVDVLDSGDGKPEPTGDHITTATDPTPDPDTEPAWAPPITVTVLGALRVHWNPGPDGADTDRRAREITGALQPRTRELLVLLALYPDGATRDALVSALWNDDPPARPTNALHTALARMRHAVATATDQTVTDIVVVGNGRYQLDPTVITVDYWRFADAVTTRRTATTAQKRVHAYQQVVDNYGGPLADGMSTAWIEPAREAIRRDAIDAVAALARALVESDPQRTLDLLEVARAFDPHNELLYRDIMRLQERLGQLDAIPRTLSLLTTRLAEVDEAPTPHARELAAGLRQRRDSTITDTPSATRGRRTRVTRR